MLEQLETWVEANKLSLKEITDKVVEIASVGQFLIIEHKEGKLINENLELILSKEEKKIIAEGEIKYVLYCFGKRWYYEDIKDFCNIKIVASFKDFKYLGGVVQEFEQGFSHLGIHSEYELLNGTHFTEDWVKKAKFLKIKALGICDKNTLAGTLPFQLDCEKVGIKSILGETVSVMYGEKEQFDLKLFVENEEGWRNLLRINKIINVDNDGDFIEEALLLKHGKGLICVFDTYSIINYKDVHFSYKIIEKYKKCFDVLLYQFDSVVYSSEKEERRLLEAQKSYLQNFFPTLPPVLLNDSYYIDQEEWRMKLALNKISHKSRIPSSDQFFKNLDDSLNRISKFFKDDKKHWAGLWSGFDILAEMVQNTQAIVDLCYYKIEVGVSKLPKFEFSEDHRELFELYVANGWASKVESLVSQDLWPKYYERLELELQTIYEFDFVDYFLILVDIFQWCEDKDVLTGAGRGSVCGSLVAYLIGLTEVDPIKYDLLFERFMNRTRFTPEKRLLMRTVDGSEMKIKTEDLLVFKKKNPGCKLLKTVEESRKDSVPDIDNDVMSGRRDDVKRYIEEKYGKDYVCSVGTYTRMAVKGGLKDFNREIGGVEFSKMNFITKQIDQQLDYNWGDIFKYAYRSKELRDYVQSHQDLMHYVKFSLNQVRAASIHASAVIIVPKEDKNGNHMTIFDWFPVRAIKIKNERFLISEWEGEYIDRAGFLKEDILGLATLDKFYEIKKLIKKNHQQHLSLTELPLGDGNVWKLFQKGYTEDIFQFGSAGLKLYCRQAKPQNIEELIIMNALYRPGAMKSGAHLDFVDIKKGKKKPEYDYMLKEVTEKTYGLYVYQEQIMKAMNVLGGMSLAQADDARSMIKHFKKDEMAKLEGVFLKGAQENGCSEKDSQRIWDKLMRFSSYGFNKAHSAAYSIMAYWGMYLKCYYPLEFYTVALMFAKSGTDDVDLPNVLSEIKQRKLPILVKQPDINHSKLKFSCDKKSNVIYWSIVNIKGVGDVIANNIMNLRKEGGKFKSLEDFCKRVVGKRVSLNLIESFILSGCFDELEKIKVAKDRLGLLEKFCKITGRTVGEKYYQSKFKVNNNWLLLQKDLTGFGEIDFETAVKVKSVILHKTFVNADLIPSLKDNEKVCVAGFVQQIIERKYGLNKKKKMGEVMIKSNDYFVYAVFWDDVWGKYKEIIRKIEEGGNILCLSGSIQYNNHKKINQVYVNKYSKIIEI